MKREVDAHREAERQLHHAADEQGFDLKGGAGTVGAETEGDSQAITCIMMRHFELWNI